MATEERVGKFTIKRKKNTSNDNFRTIAFDEDDKQVGSTFDDDIADKLAAYPDGATLVLEVDKSGRFWDIVGVRLADEEEAQSEAKSEPKKETNARTKKPAFGDHDMTYFIGSSARVIAGYLGASNEYRDKIDDADDPIDALHMDIVFGAKLMFNKANE